MVYDDETLQRYREVNAKRPGWLEIVESSGAEYILWPIAEVKPMLGPRRPADGGFSTTTTRRCWSGVSTLRAERLW